MTPRRLSQNYLLALEGLLWRHASAGAHHWGGGTGRSPVVLTLLEFAINPRDPRAGMPQANPLPGRECSPTHLQIIGLKLY